MTKDTEHRRHFSPDERPYGTYNNMFVFTGDSKRRNINPVCKDKEPCPKESDAYVFQRCILRGDIEDDLIACNDIMKQRKYAICWFARKLEKKYERICKYSSPPPSPPSSPKSDCPCEEPEPLSPQTPT